MIVVDRDDVLAAQRRIADRVRRTPLLDVSTSDQRLWLKCEHMQHTGVFKTRGAFNRILSARERGDLDPDVGIVVASGGNAGLANAYAAAALGVPANVFVPENAPLVKVERLRGYGATVHRVGRQYAEAFEAAVAFCNEHSALLCHAYDQLEVVAGAGTIGEEILEDLPETDTIVVAVGGGGLYAGIAAAAAGRAHVVTVEPVVIPTLHASLAAGEPVDVEVSGIAADSLGARRVGDIAFDIARRHPPTTVLVSDDAIIQARFELWRDYRIAAEHGAAAALAGLTSGAYQPRPDERVVVVVCGANTDVSTLTQR